MEMYDTRQQPDHHKAQQAWASRVVLSQLASGELWGTRTHTPSTHTHTPHTPSTHTPYTHTHPYTPVEVTDVDGRVAALVARVGAAALVDAHVLGKVAIPRGAVRARSAAEGLQSRQRARGRSG